MTLWAINTAVGMDSIATVFAEGVATQDEQSRNVEFVIKLLFAVCAEHITVNL